MKHKEHHHFSLYWQQLSRSIKKDQHITIGDRELASRMANILRLKPGEECTFFNQTHHIDVALTHIERGAIRGTVIAATENKVLTPSIAVLLPLLKKDAFSHALYHLVEAGVTDIHLVITEKGRHQWGNERELDRCKRVLYAAAEQSKNYAFPTIYTPHSLAEALEQLQAPLKFYGDVAGKSIMKTICSIKTEPTLLAIGPEADFSPEEKSLLQNHDFESVCLGPTVLRAETAAFYLPAIFRSVFY